MKSSTPTLALILGAIFVSIACAQEVTTVPGHIGSTVTFKGGKTNVGPGPTQNLSFSPTSLTFASQTVGTSSSPQTLTATNVGTGSFPIASVSIAGTDASDFSQTNSCPGSLTVGSNCAINVTFTPLASGSRAASVVVTPTSGPTFSAPLAGTGAGATVISSTLFGIQTHGVTPPYNPGSQDWPTVPFGFLGKGSGIVWPYIESSRGVRNWTTLDGFVAAAAANSISMMYTFEFTPGWAVSSSSTATCTTLGGALGCPALPNSMSDFTNFVTALVARYCPSGVPSIQYYELYNEPYNVYGSSSVQLAPADLATLTHAAYSIIRTNCPAAKIISPDFPMNKNSTTGSCGARGTYTPIGSYPGCYFADLGPVGTDPVDIAAVHIYADYVGSGSSADALPEALTSTGGGALHNSLLASDFATYAVGKPIWNTEGSWGSNGDTTLSTTTSGMAAFVARWYLLHWSAGYQQANWYAWDDGTFGTLCDSVSGPCTPRPVPTTAYTQVYGWMVGRTMPSGCSASGTVWSCPMFNASSVGGAACGSSVSTLAVWNTSGSSSFTPPSPATYSKYCDLSGSVTSYPGSGSVSIGVSPILFGN